MHVLTFRARLKHIEDTLWEILEKYEDFTLDTTDCFKLKGEGEQEGIKKTNTNW